MMNRSSFGDSAIVEQAAALAVYQHIEKWGKAVVAKSTPLFLPSFWFLAPFLSDRTGITVGRSSLTHKSGLSLMMALYPSQSAMFFRWREMKKASKETDKPVSEAAESDTDEDLDSDDEVTLIITTPNSYY
jgi:hypothetical protein